MYLFSKSFVLTFVSFRAGCYISVIGANESVASVGPVLQYGIHPCDKHVLAGSKYGISWRPLSSVCKWPSCLQHAGEYSTCRYVAGHLFSCMCGVVYHGNCNQPALPSILHVSERRAECINASALHYYTAVCLWANLKTEPNFTHGLVMTLLVYYFH